MAKDKIICTNIFKNSEEQKLKEEFNKKWVELINECEKNKFFIPSYNRVDKT